MSSKRHWLCGPMLALWHSSVCLWLAEMWQAEVIPPPHRQRGLPLILPVYNRKKRPFCVQRLKQYDDTHKWWPFFIYFLVNYPFKDTSVSEAGWVMSWSVLQILFHSSLDTFSTSASSPLCFSATAVTKRIAGRDPEMKSGSKRNREK